MADRQVGFVEAFASRRLGRNARLERIAAMVEWSRFEPVLDRLLPEGAGRPPYDPLVMFKALLLAQLYDLSDAMLEEHLNDKVSFRIFLGLGLEADAPDHTTLCRFRNRLGEAGLAAELFAEFDRQLEQQGLVLKLGTMIDATLVAAATARPRRGKEAEAVDPDAAFARVEDKPGSTYGYKAHIGADTDSRLIRAVVLTPGNVNESTVADQLIRGDERAVYGDKAYAKRARRARLKAAGIKDRIMHKSWGGGPSLTHWQRRRNTLIAIIRAPVEGIFAVLKRRLGYTAVRYIGLKRNLTQLQLLALAYNMKRAAAIAR